MISSTVTSLDIIKDIIPELFNVATMSPHLVMSSSAFDIAQKIRKFRLNTNDKKRLYYPKDKSILIYHSKYPDHLFIPEDGVFDQTTDSFAFTMRPAQEIFVGRFDLPIFKVVEIPSPYKEGSKTTSIGALINNISWIQFNGNYYGLSELGATKTFNEYMSMSKDSVNEEADAEIEYLLFVTLSVY